jgi:hypothetical protein
MEEQKSDSVLLSFGQFYSVGLRLERGNQPIRQNHGWAKSFGGGLAMRKAGSAGRGPIKPGEAFGECADFPRFRVDSQYDPLWTTNPGLPSAAKQQMLEHMRFPSAPLLDGLSCTGEQSTPSGVKQSVGRTII